MAKKFSLKASRVQDLKKVIDSITPQELSKFKQTELVKHSRNHDKMVLELEEADAKFNDVIGNINLGLEALVTPFRERANKLKEAGMAKEELEAAEKALNEEANAVIQKFIKEKNEDPAVQAAGEIVVEVKIGSDERFALLKDLFNEFAATRFTSRKPLIEVADALDAVTEA